MIDTKLSVDDWATATSEATQETAETMLAFEKVEVVNEKVEWPEKLSGSYIPLVSEEYKLQIGLVSDTDGCNKLTEQLLGMEPQSKEDVADSIGEIMNMIAGVVKNKVNDKVEGLKIGFPIFVIGNIHTSENMERAVIDIKMDDVCSKIIVLQLRNLKRHGA